MKKPNRETLVEDFESLVRKIAYRLIKSSSLDVEIEELTQNGMLGLLGAYDRYDPAKGVPFHTYAYYRIRGKMIDELRKLTGMKRSHARQLARMHSAKEAVNVQLANAENAEGMRVDPGALFSGVLRHVDLKERTYWIDSLGEYCGHYRSPESNAVREECRSYLKEALKMLSREDQAYIYGHYFEDRTLAELARERGVSRSWACRIHARAVSRFGKILETLDGFPDADNFEELL